MRGKINPSNSSLQLHLIVHVSEKNERGRTLVNASQELCFVNRYIEIHQLTSFFVPCNFGRITYSPTPF